MRRVCLFLAAALLAATTACAAAGSGGINAPKASAAPSFMPTPTGGQQTDPYGY